MPIKLKNWAETKSRIADFADLRAWESPKEKGVRMAKPVNEEDNLDSNIEGENTHEYFMETQDLVEENISPGTAKENVVEQSIKDNIGKKNTDVQFLVEEVSVWEYA